LSWADIICSFGVPASSSLVKVGTDYHAISVFGQRKLHARPVLNCASDGGAPLEAWFAEAAEK